MPRTRRVRATIAPKLLRQRSFRGYPGSRPQELELTKDDAAELSQRLPGKPLRWNHDDNTNLGRVIKASVVPTAEGEQLDVEMELTDETPEGEATLRQIEQGLIDGVSLKHKWGSNEPLEVSVCPKGARGPKSRIHWESNARCYTRDDDAGHVIAASLETTKQEPDEDAFTFCPVVAASFVPEPMDSTILQPGQDGLAPRAPNPAQTAAANAAAVEKGANEEKSEWLEKKIAEREAEKQAKDQASPPAEDDTLAAEIPGSLKATQEIASLLGRSNDIPTKDARAKIAERVSEMEMKAIEAEEAAQEAQKRLAASQAELERLKAEIARKSQVTDHTERILKDVVTSQKELQVLASLTPAVQQVVAGALIKASANKSTLSEEARKRMQEWERKRKAMAQKAAASVAEGAVPPADEVMVDQAPFTSFSLHRESQGRFASQGPPGATGGHVVSASSSAPRLRGGALPADYGMPIARPPVEIVVAASSGAAGGRAPDWMVQQARAEEYNKPAAEPGAVLNWYHGPTMRTGGKPILTPEQRELHLRYGDAFRTSHGTGLAFSMAERYSDDFLKSYRRGIKAMEKSGQLNDNAYAITRAGTSLPEY